MKWSGHLRCMRLKDSLMGELELFQSKPKPCTRTFFSAYSNQPQMFGKTCDLYKTINEV